MPNMIHKEMKVPSIDNQLKSSMPCQIGFSWISGWNVSPCPPVYLGNRQVDPPRITQEQPLERRVLLESRSSLQNLGFSTLGNMLAGIIHWRKEALENLCLIPCPKSRMSGTLLGIIRRGKLKNPPHPLNDVTDKVNGGASVPNPIPQP